jgi:hypothetical protein
MRQKEFSPRLLGARGYRHFNLLEAQYWDVALPDSKA